MIRGFIVERGTKGFSTPKIEGKFIAARLDHRRDRAARTRSCRRTTCCRTSPGLAGPFGCLNKRALRHRLGRDGRRRVLLARARGSTRSTASSSAGRSPPTSSIQKKLADMQTEIALGLHGALRARPPAGAGQGRAAERSR